MVRKGYKRTEVGEIPEDWEALPCASLSRLITVGVVVRPTQYYATTGVPALRSANIREAGIDCSDMVFFSDAANRILAKSQLRAGDVVSVRTGYPGTSAVVPARLEGANCIDVLITRPRETVNSAFLAAWINSPLGKTQVLRAQGGLAQQHFNVGELRALIIALPKTKEEQNVIATALGDTDALIDSLEHLLAKKRAIKQGAMQSLLTGSKRLPGFTGAWPEVAIGSLGEPYGGLSGMTKNDFGHGSSRYVTFMNVISNVSIDIQSLERVHLRNPDAQARVQLGDLLLNGSSETPGEVGLCALMEKDLPGVFLNSFCFGFRLRDKMAVNGLYLANWFRCREGRKRLWALAQGAIRYNLSKAALLQVRLPLPSPSEQTAIVEVLTDLDADLDATSAKLAKARAIKQGMMQELLTGRIRLV